MLSPSKQNPPAYTSADNGQFDNPFAQSSSDAILSNDAYIEPDLDLSGQSTTRPSYPPTSSAAPSSQPNPFAQPSVSGRIGTAYQPQATTTTSGYTGEDTLDEPVSVTIVSTALAYPPITTTTTDNLQLVLSLRYNRCAIFDKWP